MRTLTVRGYGSVDAEPDRVEVGLVLTGVAPTADAAYADVAGRAVALSALLDELSVPPAHRATSGLALQEERDYEGKPNGYRAQSRTVVRLADAEAVAMLVAQAVEASGAGVEGLSWSVDRASPAWLDACRLAATTARDRAAAYAEGLGLPLGQVVEAVEPGSEPAPVARMRGITVNHPVEPGQARVGAALDVTFVLGDDG
jgi:uncharacterized protein